MLTKNIIFKNFNFKSKIKKVSNFFKEFSKEENEIINSLKKTYKDSYSIKIFKKLKRYKYVVLIGMGGSVLGSRSIYSFLQEKIKKKFFFQDSFELLKLDEKNKKDQLNLVISKSGNTLETISNSNILINKSNKNVFITENKKVTY